MQTSTLAPAASVAVPSSSGDCSQLPEGALVANGPCSTTFSKCNYGQAIQRTCPAQLVFNAVSGQCDYQQNVPGCSSDVATTQCK
jgi:hypothetical protein